MDKKNIIVMGASAGGFEALKQVVAELPSNLDAAIFIVWHISPETTGVLPAVLNKLNTLRASNARDGEPITMGHIYIAPPDRHLLIESNYLRVTKGPKENRFRPAVDPLFRSAAYTYGSRVIGVILSGALDDGTSGLWTIKERGGIAIVQDPLDAEVPAMPLNAIQQVNIDYTLPASQIGPLLTTLCAEPALPLPHPTTEENKRTDMEVHIALQDGNYSTQLFEEMGTLTPFTCPECNGVLAAIIEGDRIRYRCHTGHAFSADSLLAAITEQTENTLWSAVREMQETVMLLNSIGDHFSEHNKPHEAAAYFQKAKDMEERNQRMKDIILHYEHLSTDTIQEKGSKKEINKLAS